MFPKKKWRNNDCYLAFHLCKTKHNLWNNFICSFSKSSNESFWRNIKHDKICINWKTRKKTEFPSHLELGFYGFFSLCKFIMLNFQNVCFLVNQSVCMLCLVYITWKKCATGGHVILFDFIIQNLFVAWRQGEENHKNKCFSPAVHWLCHDLLS